MSDLKTAMEADDTPTDGRMARRQRNIDAVLDVVLEMFAEDAMFPTIEQAATRSGLSLRSLYRYFADPAELLEAVIQRSDDVGQELSHIHAIGEGSIDDRIEAFVASRLRLHEAIGPVYRATGANAARHPRIQLEQTKNRNKMREQFELQFAPELKALKKADRDVLVASGDLLTQLGSIDYLRRHRELTSKQAAAVLTRSLSALFGLGL